MPNMVKNVTCAMCGLQVKIEDTHYFNVDHDVRRVCVFCLVSACRNHAYQRIEALRSLESFFDTWRERYLEEGMNGERANR